MKKFAVSIAAICAMMFFVACGGNSSGNTDTGDSTTDTGDSTTDTGDSTTDTGDSTTDTGDSTTDTGDSTTDTGDSTTDTGDSTTDTGDSTTDTGDSTTDTGDSEPDDDTEPADTACTEEEQQYAKYLGRWAQEIILHSKSSTTLAKNVPSITTRYVLADFYINDKCQLDMKKVDNKLCRTDNRTGDNVANKGNVLFNEPDSKFNTIFRHWKPYDIEGQEDMPYIEISEEGDFIINKDWELRGANMENPATEDMVADDNDTRIFDHDQDSKAAFTIKFNGFVSGPIYYVQRLSHVFTGHFVADNKVEGNIEWTDEQYAHQDTPNLTLKGQKTTDTFTDKSIFQFVKVDDDMNCETMLQQVDAGTLFDLVDPNAGDATGK